MTATPVQSATGYTFGGLFPTATLPMPATEGNLLVYCTGGNAVSDNTEPGFTLLVSGFYASIQMKIAEGGEQVFTTAGGATFTDRSNAIFEISGARWGSLDEGEFNTNVAPGTNNAAPGMVASEYAPNIAVYCLGLSSNTIDIAWDNSPSWEDFEVNESIFAGWFSIETVAPSEPVHWNPGFLRSSTACVATAKARLVTAGADPLLRQRQVAS